MNSDDSAKRKLYQTLYSGTVTGWFSSGVRRPDSQNNPHQPQPSQQENAMPGKDDMPANLKRAVVAAVSEDVQRNVAADITRQVMDNLSKPKPLTPEEMMSLVLRSGENIVVPPTIGLDNAITILVKQLNYESQFVRVNGHIEGSYWDAAHAFYKAMADVFGWVGQATIPGGFFTPDKPPTMVELESGIGRTVTIPIGRFLLETLGNENDEGGQRQRIDTSEYLDEESQRVFFAYDAWVARKNEPIVKRIIAKARDYLATESLYRGQAVRIRFTDNKGNPVKLPRPRFIDVAQARPENLILPADVQAQVETSIFTPILYTKEVRAQKIPLKRGVLLAGPFGTGKTLTAYVTANLARMNKWTFLYCDKANELADTVRLAMNYEPCVVFCEDIDREMAGGRTADMDKILNVIDGIESKQNEIMIVVTTNFAEKINEALLRPGRLDAVIEFKAPDAEAAIRLVRHYGGLRIDAETDLVAVGAELAGKIPAVIRETVERAKLATIKLSGGQESAKVLAQALLESAKSMSTQLDLLNRDKGEPSEADRLFDGVVAAARQAAGVQSTTDSIAAAVVKKLNE